ELPHCQGRHRSAFQLLSTARRAASCPHLSALPLLAAHPRRMRSLSFVDAAGVPGGSSSTDDATSSGLPNRPLRRVYCVGCVRVLQRLTRRSPPDSPDDE